MGGEVEAQEGVAMAYVYKDRVGRWYVAYRHGGKLWRYAVGDRKACRKRNAWQPSALPGSLG